MTNSPPSEALIGLIRSAVRMELDGREFYRRAAMATAHTSGQRVFSRLAEDDLHHVVELRAMFAELVGEPEWQRIVTEAAVSAERCPVVAELEAAVAARGRDDLADDTQALRIAMELERRALSYFDGLREQAEDPRQRALLHELAEAARFHYDFLQSELDSVLNVGIWLDAPEFRQDGKF